MQTTESTSLSASFSAIARTEGLGGFYRGFWFAFAVSIPASCLYFTTYEKLKGDSPLSHFVSGLVAESVSCVLWVPCDVIKERMQVATRQSSSYGQYATGRQAIRHVISTEGFPGLYKGYMATLASFGPFSACYFMFYEEMRKHFVQRLYPDMSAPPPALAFWILGGTAGGLAAWVTSPLDLVKLRRQVHVGEFHYANMLQGLLSIVNSEGVPGLWRGAVPRVCFSASNAAVSMCLFEYFKRVFAVH